MGDIGFFEIKAILYMMNRLACFIALYVAVAVFGAMTILTFFLFGVLGAEPLGEGVEEDA